MEKVNPKAESEDPDAEPPEDAPRQRTLTEKGLQYTLAVKEKRLNQLCAALDKQNSAITDMLTTDVGDAVITRLYKRWMTIFDDFLTTGQAFSNLLTDERKEDFDNDFFEPRKDAYGDLKVAAMEWIMMKSRHTDN